MPPKEFHEDFVETHGKESPSYSTVKKWAAEFKRERVSVEDDRRSGHPKDATTVENVKVVHTLVMCDLRSIASEVGISFGALQSILTDILGMSKNSARWVPQMLTADQKRTRLHIFRYLLSCYEEDPGDLIKQVVTQAETWVHHFDPESKCRANDGSTLAHPLLRNLRGFIYKFSRDDLNILG